MGTQQIWAFFLI
jgi:choline-glycine betaine transporter